MPAASNTKRGNGMIAKTEQQRWRRLSQLFEQMADMPVDARAAFLDSECGGDLPMRAQLERMLVPDIPA